MERRGFLLSCGTVPAALFLNSCAARKLSGDRPVLVDTLEQRERYTRRMLRELVTDVGPHPVGTPACKKVEAAIEREMRRSLPIVETDRVTFDRWVIRGTPEFTVGGNRIEICPSHGTSGTPGPVSGILKKSAKPMVAYDLVNPSTGALLAYVTESPKQHPTPRPWWFYDEETGKLANVCVGKRDFPRVTGGIRKGDDRPAERPHRIPPQSHHGKHRREHSRRERGRKSSITPIMTPCTTHREANDNIAAVIMVMLIAHILRGNPPEKNAHLHCHNRRGIRVSRHETPGEGLEGERPSGAHQAYRRF